MLSVSGHSTFQFILCCLSVCEEGLVGAGRVMVSLLCGGRGYFYRVLFSCEFLVFVISLLLLGLLLRVVLIMC